jgi:zinc protease
LPAPVRTVEDIYAFHLVDAVWGGGGFGTRLNLNLREDKGYSYGVFSNEIFYSRGGIWTAGGGVQTCGATRSSSNRSDGSRARSRSCGSSGCR